MKAQGYLAKKKATVKQTSDASKERRGAAEALALAREVDRIVAARGKNFVVYNLRRNPPDEETLLSVLLGPSGNLRAPTLRKGKTLLVGFHADAYQEELG